MNEDNVKIELMLAQLSDEDLADVETLSANASFLSEILSEEVVNSALESIINTMTRHEGAMFLEKIGRSVTDLLVFLSVSEGHTEAFYDEEGNINIRSSAIETLEEVIDLSSEKLHDLIFEDEEE